MSIPDLKGLLETAQRIQSEVARVREELAGKTVVGESGGGLCRCTVNGKGDEAPDHSCDDAVRAIPGTSLEPAAPDRRSARV